MALLALSTCRYGAPMYVHLMVALSLAAPEQGLSPYDVDFAADGVATAAMLGIILIAEAGVKSSLQGGLTCTPLPDTGRCDPSKLNAVDRTIAGNRSKAWLQASDVTGAAALVLPVIGTLIDSWSSDSSRPGLDAGKDLLVMAEAVATATFVTHLLKYAVRRPRPTQYTEGSYVGSVEHQLSFPSGHTASAASVAAAYATTFALRHPDSPWRFLIMGLGVGIAGVTGYARVGGGMHFYTDVVAGALLGGSLGFLVPYLHRNGVNIQPTVEVGSTGTASRGLSLTAAF